MKQAYLSEESPRRKADFTQKHGTIRGIPFEAGTQGRLCAFFYRQAGMSFITNTTIIMRPVLN